MSKIIDYNVQLKSYEIWPVVESSGRTHTQDLWNGTFPHLPVWGCTGAAETCYHKNWGYVWTYSKNIWESVNKQRKITIFMQTVSLRKGSKRKYFAEKDHRDLWCMNVAGPVIGWGPKLQPSYIHKQQSLCSFSAEP